MKTQKYLVTIEMPDGDMIGPGWIKDLIEADCDVEDVGRQKASVIEIKDTDSNLEDIATKYAENVDRETDYNGEWLNVDDIANAFTDGAKWMAEQGVSWEDKMTYYDGFLLYGKDERAFTMEGNFNEGDEVIVQIRKKEESK